MLDKKDLELIAGVVNTAIRPINQRLDVIEQDIAGLKEDVAGLKRDVVMLNEKVSVLDEKVSVLDEKVAGLQKRTTALEQSVSEMQVKLDEVDNRVRRLELTLENETNRNIRFIAEAHLNLDRKLNEAIKLSQDSLSFTEKFHIRQVCFECELSLMEGRVCKLEKQCAFCRQPA